MPVKFLTLVVVLFLTGCYVQTPKKSIVVVEKSSHLENINHQRLKKIAPNTNSSQINKPLVKKTAHWKMPVKADIIQKFSNKHQKIVFETQNKQEIYAIRDGKIIHIAKKPQGQSITIRHAFGFDSIYTNTQTLKISLNEQIKQGRVIAYTTNQPFYFEMKKFNQAINPLNYLK